MRGRAAGALEGVASKRWRQLERFAQALRSLGDKPMTRASAERLAKRAGVHWATVYRYRASLREVDEATAIAGRNRGWKPLASRLSVSLQAVTFGLSICHRQFSGVLDGRPLRRD